jgi:hypothetical protein
MARISRRDTDQLVKIKKALVDSISLRMQTLVCGSQEINKRLPMGRMVWIEVIGPGVFRDVIQVSRMIIIRRIMRR